ncbi:CCR4-NOT transcription complex subunit 4 isoform X2 [Neocloeon triangulifer]|uniref:CCR4-NOT transcription complex subunit 4 isoform X2 n=1 Tax=Neocloeon triangulifer TaxID=2078957 RepID=UPI00286F1C8F|nr:CCR4-NOT transcription complex subunit 4 isoform X2 [Neocloeon triangulifer]
MSVLNQCGDEPAECPLCMEHLEVDDLNFFPCTCGYQICRFCWHRIRTDENGLCPACRKAYPENPADFRPLSTAEIQKIKVEKRQKDQQRKQKVTESRQHLASVRVVQRNLVFVVGLPPRLADGDILKKHEYFGKFGKILKVVINPCNSYAGVQGPSASAYVTYVKREDSLRAIAAVNNISVDGRLLKASLGTTKYCSNFLKNQACPKPECMYLHELDAEASFTKDDMQQGKHQEYERKLHEQLQNQTKEPISNDNHTPSIHNLDVNISSNNNNNKDTWPLLQDDQERSSSSSSSPAPPSETPKLDEITDNFNGQRKKDDRKIRDSYSQSKELSPVHQQAPSPSSSTSSLSGGPTSSTMQQSQSLSSSSSSISEDVLQSNASETQVALEEIQNQAGNSYFSSSQFDFNSQHKKGIQKEAQGGMMQENLMPLLNSFDWQSAFGFGKKPEENTNNKVQATSKDIEDDLGFDPFAETQKALEELIKTEKQQQVLQQQRSAPPQMNPHYRPHPTIDMHRTTAPPPGFANQPMRHNFQTHFNEGRAMNSSHFQAQESKILPIMNLAQHPSVSKDDNSFNMAHWRHILPNIGSASPNYSNGLAHRQMQAQQQRDWQNDWTAMDPAIVAASASNRIMVDNSWNKQVDQNSYYQHSNNSLGWSGVVPNLAATTAPPPGFSHPFRMATRSNQPPAMDSELKSLLHQLH